MVCCLASGDERPCISVCFRSPWWSQQNNSPVLDLQRLWQLVVHKSDMPSKKFGSFFRRHPPPRANLASSFRRSLGVWILSFRTWDGDRDCVCSSSFLLTLAVTGLIKKRSKYFLLERSVLHAHATISQGENQNIEWQLDRVIGYDVFDKFIKLLLQKIMGAFFAPLLVISGAKLYFLGAVLPFALVYFRRWTEAYWEPISARVR